MLLYIFLMSSAVRYHSHVVGLSDKPLHAVASMIHSRASNTNDGRRGFHCRVLSGQIDCIIVSEPIKRGRACNTRNWFKRGAMVLLSSFRVPAIEVGVWDPTTGLANTATAAVKRTEGIVKQRIIERRAKEV